ncbi:hypothetical protein [Hartmannibacter diazotrophicus]|uniref:hypothetical protein n=1 Tax=Hartmannibacter diazotrophicus TaxID=1482074 RepID=UPI0012FD0BD7|nr:hypothetical protein [Hartmannibacter diazotrophicus]
MGAMIEHGTEVKAICRKCRQSFKVDLNAICKIHGEGYSLIAKHPPCRVFECDGEVIFYYKHGVFRPMTR